MKTLKFDVQDRFLLVMNVLISAVFITLFTSCEEKNVYEQFQKVSGRLEPTIDTISFEAVKLDSVHCSGESFSWISSDGKICYYDNYFCWLYTFDGDGHLQNRRLGYGRGPNELLIRQGMVCAMSNDGEFAICGNTYDYEYYSAEMGLKHRFMLKQEKNSLDPKNYMTYTTADFDICARLNDEKLYMGMTSDSEKFSFFTTPAEYISESYRIGVIDLRKGKAMPMEIKGFPPIYAQDHQKYTSFDGVDFDIDREGNFYIGFRADSLVYVFDKNLKPRYAFGVSGKGMDRDYESVTMDNLRAYGRNLSDKGYYSWVEFVDETKTCFRSYKKGSMSDYDGLQIYKDGQMVGDCSVPKGLKVTGYIEPYYYSQVFNDNDEGLTIYRFKL